LRSFPISAEGRIEAVISAAERRRLLVLAVEQAGVASALLLAGFISMLLLGTRILDWYWLALLAFVGLGLVATRVRARPVAPYRLAQLLDERLQLNDSLSTAWFLLSHRPPDQPFARFQITRAGEIAQSIRPARAFPFAGRRTWAFSTVLAVVAFGLFAVRYLTTDSLSLQQALLPIHLEPVFEAEQAVFGKTRKGKAAYPAANINVSQAGAADQRDSKIRASLPEKAQPGNPSGAVPGRATPQNAGAKTSAQEMTEGNTPDKNGSRNESQQQPNGNDSASRETADSKQQGSETRQASSGVLDKMRDALSSLMSQMRSNPNSARSARENQASDPRENGADQSALGKGQQSDQQNLPSKQNGQQQSTEGQAQGQTTEKAQASQGRNSDSTGRKGSDSQSGAGHQDGEKAIKEAEEQKALGKLAEIIGKRSASLTGDMSVESPSGNQQLKTQYSSRLGRHSDLGGEINRDEIPLMYQQYIRDYMEAVRKQQQRSQ